jgi:hypothetical protein
MKTVEGNVYYVLLLVVVVAVVAWVVLKVVAPQEIFTQSVAGLDVSMFLV